MGVTMQNKVVLISGASSGLGRDAATYLHERGYRVFGASRRFPDPSLPFETLNLDVCDDSSVASAVANVIERAGRIDVLVNVAGILLSGALENHSTEEVRAIFETNTLGTFRMCRAVLPQMRKQERGQIVNVSSLVGLIAIPYASAYAASKFAVEGMTESLRLEVERFHIAVSLLEPGDFLTAMTETYRFTAASETDTVYRTHAERAVKVMEADCRSSPDVRIFSRRLEEIISEPKPALRYTVGPLMQRAAVPVHRLIPNTWFEHLVRGTYLTAETDGGPLKSALDLTQSMFARLSEKLAK
jgi:NAD(P)-dependent dehydrogenase (short-subunit alcohol dehydrogenase family)